MDESGLDGVDIRTEENENLNFPPVLGFGWRRVLVPLYIILLNMGWKPGSYSNPSPIYQKQIQIANLVFANLHPT